MKYDFSGWATRNDLLCGDGRTIRKDAFAQCDGETVPLYWNHNHNNLNDVLGHALLENRDEGVYAYCYFNDTEEGRSAKARVQHGDIRSLSIYANKLKQVGNDVIHGVIRELSLVPAGANPGAFIDYVLEHGEQEDDGIIAGYDEYLTLYHSDETNSKEAKDMADENKKKVDEEEETVADVFDTLTEKQKTVVYAIIGQALEDSDTDEDEDDEEESSMKHNIFEQNNYPVTNDGVLCHADQEAVLNLAKKGNVGSFQTALQMFADDNDLQHDAISGGFYETAPTEGARTIYDLFPEYKEVRPGAPELITNDQGWVTTVMRKVHKSPISRIRTSQVDIRNIDAIRAKGYKKGKQKVQSGNFNLVRRTTDPQTVYVKNALHRDDIVDITDFDYVQYLYNIDRMMLNEELATAIMLGDGREEGDEAKISGEHIRPIWLDDELYTLHVDLDIEATKEELQGEDTNKHFGTNFIYAEAIINKLLHAREQFKGSGTPDLYCTPKLLNTMLLARDFNGRRIYSSKAELASALNVGEINTAEQFEGKTRVDGQGNTKKLLAIVANLSDYSLGATKGGEVTHFTQFDIDFNQEKSLLETRCSGALTRVYSAIALEEAVESGSNNP